MPAAAQTRNPASDLRLVLGQLVRRLRADDALPISLFAVLSRLDRGGSQTTSGLAAGERMRPQSMAQTVAELERAGYVDRRPDADDRRQVLVRLTPRGRALLDGERRKRQDWLSRAIAEELTADEQDVLLQAVDLLRRLASASTT